MTNDLAQKLKDAGFPQPPGSKGPHMPDLSELIKACGKYFWSLRHTPEDKWLASGRLTSEDNKVPYYETTSYDKPEAAVAELFLVIKLHEGQ